jgi:excisionase family DNA binding protein
MTTASTQDPSALLDVRHIAALLGCSPRTCYRLADAGKMPRPRRLGTLVRRSRTEIDESIADGGRPFRTPSTKGER